MATCTDADLHRDWNYLQASDHFYYMCTKWFSDGDVHQYFTPYGTPYEAFLNYMNVLADFEIRVKEYAANQVVAEVIPVTTEAVAKMNAIPDGKSPTVKPSKTKVKAVADSDKKPVSKAKKEVK